MAAQQIESRDAVRPSTHTWQHYARPVLRPEPVTYMSTPDKTKAAAELKTALEAIRKEAGPELFQEIVDEVTLAFGPTVRQELADGKITEDHPGYQALLNFERRQAAAAKRPATRRNKGKRP
jgi:hypothetical protein